MDIADSYRRVAPRFAGLLAPIGTGTLHVATFTLSTPEDVVSWVRQAGLVVGWSILWGMESTVWISVEPSVLILQGNRPGDGEFFAAGEDGGLPVSLRVRHMGSQWHCTAYGEEQKALRPFGTPSSAMTLSGLWQPRRQLVDPRFDLGESGLVAQADYRVWWVDDAETGFGPAADVFMGFTLGPREVDDE